ncbi:hypothetical protein DFR58_10429 [Anaerobacterium chartisolvens]|uniref:Uncharacterized protein n=1 Tax=Anaerobacterium chartisolvens TaxID=1297424 RepID=A0A369BB56_9FIRM|nr:hypothetical protein DFR58_10429 [Anaerobacterium chartisolvens]
MQEARHFGAGRINGRLAGRQQGGRDSGSRREREPPWRETSGPGSAKPPPRECADAPGWARYAGEAARLAAAGGEGCMGGADVGREGRRKPRRWGGRGFLSTVRYLYIYWV